MKRHRLPSAMTLLLCLCCVAIAAEFVVPAGVAERLAVIRQRIKAKGLSFTVGYNPAMDYQQKQLCGLKPPPAPAGFFPQPLSAAAPAAPLPARFDWRDVDGLTPVRDQGGCGSCWAFATVGVLEAAIKLQEASEQDLSEQWLVSCNTSGWDCDGGWWAHDYHVAPGAVPEGQFSYVASDAPCGGPYDYPFQIESWSYVGNSYSVPAIDAIKQAIYSHGPVTIAVYVSSDFTAYTGGVFDSHKTGTVNHGVILTGWDDDQGPDGVWFLRNSWGPGWGESGYMRIAYDTANVGYAASYVVYDGVSPQGQIHFDHDSYVPPASAAISVSDADLDANPATPDTVLIELASTTESTPEFVLCTETGDSTKRFVGTIELAIGLPTADGRLQVGSGDTITAIYHDADTGDGTPADVHDTAFVLTMIYTFPMDEDPGWSTGGEWAFGQPTGAGGAYGCPDPASGFDGPNVYGYNLGGDYANDIAGPQHLTTAALDLSGWKQTALQFRRWLGVERNTFDHASVQVSNDGSTWVTLWENGDTHTADGEWKLVSYDLSAVADEHATVYVRWGLGPTDYSWTYCGWNVDDVQIIGVPAAPLPTATPTPTPTQTPTFTATPTPDPTCYGCDVNGDGEVSFADLGAFSAAYGTTSGDPLYRDGFDINNDGVIDFDDISGFSACFGASW